MSAVNTEFPYNFLHGMVLEAPAPAVMIALAEIHGQLCVVADLLRESNDLNAAVLRMVSP